MAKQKLERLAPVEESALTPAAEKRRPDPKPLQRAWGALGAATGSALLATIVGPMVASATEASALREHQSRMRQAHQAALLKHHLRMSISPQARSHPKAHQLFSSIQLRL